MRDERRRVEIAVGQLCRLMLNLLYILRDVPQVEAIFQRIRAHQARIVMNSEYVLDQASINNDDLAFLQPDSHSNPHSTPVCMGHGTFRCGLWHIMFISCSYHVRQDFEGLLL